MPTTRAQGKREADTQQEKVRQRKRSTHEVRDHKLETLLLQFLRAIGEQGPRLLHLLRMVEDHGYLIISLDALFDIVWNAYPVKNGETVPRVSMVAARLGDSLLNFYLGEKRKVDRLLRGQDDWPEKHRADVGVYLREWFNRHAIFNDKSTSLRMAQCLLGNAKYMRGIVDSIDEDAEALYPGTNRKLECQVEEETKAGYRVNFKENRELLLGDDCTWRTLFQLGNDKHVRQHQNRDGISKLKAPGGRQPVDITSLSTFSVITIFIDILIKGMGLQNAGPSVLCSDKGCHEQLRHTDFLPEAQYTKDLGDGVADKDKKAKLSLENAENGMYGISIIANVSKSKCSLEGWFNADGSPLTHGNNSEFWTTVQARSSTQRTIKIERQHVVLFRGDWVHAGAQYTDSAHARMHWYAVHPCFWDVLVADETVSRYTFKDEDQDEDRDEDA